VLAARARAHAATLAHRRDVLAARARARAATLAHRKAVLAAQAQARAWAKVPFVCPVQGGGLNFIDSWGFARSGGRSHKGTDMMAAYGTPTVAPVSGRVEHRTVNLGGNAWYLYGDDGNMYYGAHLSRFAHADGWVAKGTVIGFVGESGDAAGTSPHLHFELHPGGGSAVNSFPLVSQYCPGG
jgi:murein DD-endopeptidase MepM/ murein hydrolase activator NlpD